MKTIYYLLITILLLNLLSSCTGSIEGFGDDDLITKLNLSVTSPAQGDFIWLGDDTTITWENSEEELENIKIELVSKDEVIKLIDPQAENTGSYIWESVDGAPEYPYSIRLTPVGKKNTGVYSDSPVFTIRELRSAASIVDVREKEISSNTSSYIGFYRVPEIVPDFYLIECDLRPEGEQPLNKILLSVDIENPTGFCLNIGDSYSNDGYGGDHGNQTNDAEAFIYPHEFSLALSVYNSENSIDADEDGIPEQSGHSTSIHQDELHMTDDIFNVTYIIEDEKLTYWKNFDQANKVEVESKFLFELSGPGEQLYDKDAEEVAKARAKAKAEMAGADAEAVAEAVAKAKAEAEAGGVENHKIYIALNGVNLSYFIFKDNLNPEWERTGSGITRAYIGME